MSRHQHFYLLWIMRNFRRKQYLLQRKRLFKSSKHLQKIYYVFNYPEASTLNFLKAVCRLSSSPSLASDFIVKVFTLLWMLPLILKNKMNKMKTGSSKVYLLLKIYIPYTISACQGEKSKFLFLKGKVSVQTIRGYRFYLLRKDK